VSAPRGPEGSLRAWADQLTGVAERSIDAGLTHGEPAAVDVGAYPPPLRQKRAVFVTLVHRCGHLRGCVGSLEAERALVAEVSSKAFAAAFRDPRFRPLTASERVGLRCTLSVLTPLEPVTFTGEADLLRRVEPGRDGLLIVAGALRATLLPQVWADLPEPLEFWRALKRKAGIPEHASPPELRVYRYRTEHIDY